MVMAETMCGLQILYKYFFFLLLLSALQPFLNWKLEAFLRSDLHFTIWWMMITWWSSRMKYLWVTAGWLTCSKGSFFFLRLLQRYYSLYISYLHLTPFYQPSTPTFSLSMQNSLSFSVYFTLHFSPIPSLRSLHAWTDKSCFAKDRKCIHRASYHYRMKNIWLLKRLSICCQCEQPKFFGMHWGIHRPWRQLQEGALRLDFMGFTLEILICLKL